MNDTSVIAAGHHVVGTISAAEDLVVQGRVEGRIQSEATVVIEAHAIVEGPISARHVIIKGVVVGEVNGVDYIEVAASAQVAGDLKTRRLTLRPGGRVNGEVQTGIEVSGYIMSGKSSTGSSARWQRGSWVDRSSRDEEVVEPSSRSFSSSSSSDDGNDEARPHKEPSREAH